jgi:hypothetical protein
MKNLLIAVVTLLLFTTCSQLEPDLTGIGEVKFQSVLVDSFSGNLPNGRIAGPSTWKHIFKNPAVMEIKNKVTGQEYKFDYNPNQFGEGIKFPLPYGSYTYKTEVSGGAFEKFLPFRAEGEFNLGVANLEVKIQATTDYGLITVKNEFVKSLAIRYGSETCEFKLLPDQSFYFIYAKKGQTAKMEIIESLTDKLIKRDVDIKAYNHYNFFLKKAEMNGTVNFIELALTVFEYVEEGIEIGEAPNNQGLILWNKLGSLGEVQHSEVGPNGKVVGSLDFGLVKFGNGVIPKDGNFESGVDFPSSIFSPESGTIEFWMKAFFLPEPYDFGVYGFINNTYYESARQPLHWFWHNPTYNTVWFKFGLSDGVKIEISDFNPEINKPVHMALVWDRNGIEGTEETIRMYINGAVKATSKSKNWGTDNGGESRIANGWDWDYSENRFAMDNFKVFNFAKTDFSDREIEGN